MFGCCCCANCKYAESVRNERHIGQEDNTLYCAYYREFVFPSGKCSSYEEEWIVMMRRRFYGYWQFTDDFKLIEPLHKRISNNQLIFERI